MRSCIYILHMYIYIHTFHYITLHSLHYITLQYITLHTYIHVYACVLNTGVCVCVCMAGKLHERFCKYPHALCFTYPLYIYTVLCIQMCIYIYTHTSRRSAQAGAHTVHITYIDIYIILQTHAHNKFHKTSIL